MKRLLDALMKDVEAQEAAEQKAEMDTQIRRAQKASDELRRVEYENRIRCMAEAQLAEEERDRILLQRTKEQMEKQAQRLRDKEFNASIVLIAAKTRLKARLQEIGKEMGNLRTSEIRDPRVKEEYMQLWRLAYGEDVKEWRDVEDSRVRRAREELKNEMSGLLEGNPYAYYAEYL
jgi:hypothetical protein